MTSVFTSQAARAQTIDYCYVNSNMDCSIALTHTSENLSCGSCSSSTGCSGVGEEVVTANTAKIDFVAKYPDSGPTGDFQGKDDYDLGSLVECGTSHDCLASCLPPNSIGQTLCAREVIGAFYLAERFIDGAFCNIMEAQ
jgi:hypothetical protein